MTRLNGVQYTRCSPASRGSRIGVDCADTLDGGPLLAAMSPLRCVHAGSRRPTLSVRDLRRGAVMPAERVAGRVRGLHGTREQQHQRPRRSGSQDGGVQLHGRQCARRAAHREGAARRRVPAWWAGATSRIKLRSNNSNRGDKPCPDSSRRSSAWPAASRMSLAFTSSASACEPSPGRQPIRVSVGADGKPVVSPDVVQCLRRRDHPLGLQWLGGQAVRGGFHERGRLPFSWEKQTGATVEGTIKSDAVKDNKPTPYDYNVSFDSQASDPRIIVDP